MQFHEKSVKLFAICLFTNTGSGIPLCLNKRKQFTPKDVNSRNFILRHSMKFPDFVLEKIRALAQFFYIS
jgi:hypothetical protein